MNFIKYFLSLLFVACVVDAAKINVADFGAKGDGSMLCTQMIQRAIDAAAQDGSGEVRFPRGVYLTGAIFVKSGVELILDEGVILSAVRDDAAYPELQTRIAGIEMKWPAAVVNVYRENKVKISGSGVIDGQGDFWWNKFWGKDRKGGMVKDYSKRGLRWAADYDCKRVRALAIYDSKDVEVSGVTINRSGFWSLSMTYCERVTIRGVTIRANIGGIGPSSDGIDIDSSKTVLVEGCDIDCNDDNICLKSGRDADGLRVNRPTEDVVVRDCITRAGHGMIVLGSETSGGLRNVEAYRLKAYGTKYGIRFKSARIRGGVVENIRLHDIEMKDVPNPIHLELNWYPAYSYPTLPKDVDPAAIPSHWKTLMTRVEPAERGIPLFRDIEISNVKVLGAERAFFVNAFSEKPMAKVLFKNVEIQAQKAGSIANAKDWTFDNVRIVSAGGEAVALENCSAVEPPPVLKAVKPTP